MEALIERTKENQQLMIENDKCDKYDYLIAVGCGAIGGLIDVFLVGAPGDSVLGNWTDKQVEEMVVKFANIIGADKTGDAQKAIKSLQDKYKINYDQSTTNSVGDRFSLAPNNHHMKSLGHSPDVVGLFFSVLNQFTETSSFLSDGKLITIDSNFELQGHNFITKILCGIANWFGHIMSDIAGSSTSQGRGTGIVMPFYELFGLCKFGRFNTLENGRVVKKDLAEIATKAFSQGYDFRFGMTQAIPVVVTDLSIRLIWSIRRYFQYGYDIKDCIPINTHPDLRVMIIVGNGTLCLMDGLDAGIKSGGNYLAFFMRLNYIAWLKLLKMVIKEVCIRLGILQNDLTAQIEALKRVDAAIDEYLIELKNYDIAGFELETEKYNIFVEELSCVTSQEDLNIFLLNTYKDMDIKLPWEGDFDEFMSNPSNQLIF